jgi:hypothetical protein
VFSSVASVGAQFELELLSPEIPRTSEESEQVLLLVQPATLASTIFIKSRIM